MSTRSTHLLLALCVTLVFAGAARGDEGVVQINQESIVAAGGFPFAIGASGSYRLTGNLIVASAADDAIQIVANDVTLDLGGFRIEGPGPLSTGDGIDGDNSFTGIVVRNGAVSGFGRGIALGDVCAVDEVRAFGNQGTGITVGASCRVSGVSASLNDLGISVGLGSIVLDSSARMNTNEGMRTTDAALIRDSSATFNGDDGFGLAPRSTLLRSSSADNGEDGVSLDTGGLVRSTAIYGNSEGVNAVGIGAIAESVLRSNGLSPQISGTHVELGENVCDADTTCP